MNYQTLKSLLDHLKNQLKALILEIKSINFIRLQS